MAAVLFIVLTAFVFVVFTFFMINLGVTHEHQRHLQVQVDDGALAAGTFFTGCFQAPSVANASIAREAHRFSGDPTYPTNYDATDPSYPANYNTATYPGPFNQQVTNPGATVGSAASGANVVIGLNKPTYAPYAAPYTDFDPSYDLRPVLPNGDPDPTIQNLPCDSDILDVKATDSNIPARFGNFLPSSSVTVHARARVEIKKVQVLNGFLPWAVPEVRPKAVIAIFVDESDGTVSGVQLLNDTNTTPSLNGSPSELWENQVSSFSHHSTGGTGVVIGISGNPLAAPPGGSLASICGMAKMTCYSGSTSTSGLWFIQGYASGGTGTAAIPIVRSVTLQAVSCPNDSGPPGNASSDPYFVLNGPCTAQVTAGIDFGTGAADPRQFPTCAAVSGMSWAGGVWTGTVTIPDNSGRNTVNISWTSGHSNPNNCNGNPPNGDTFSKVAAPYAADDNSGPINYVTVTTGGGQLLGSLAKTPNPVTVGVQVGLQPPLHVAQTNTEPPIILRLGSGHGSKTQALLCDKGKQLEDMVRDGCQTNYAVNMRGETCTGPPGPTWTVANLPPSFPPPQPNPAPDCIQWKTGQVTSMFKGMHARFESPCTPNNWVAFRTAFQNGTPVPTDKRYVPLIVADASYFGGNGNGVLPIRVFAGFYVTGWYVKGGNSTQGCPGNDLPPPPICPSWPNDNGSAGCDPSNKANDGNVWGYFVTIVILGGTGPATEYCDFSEIGLCVARLTQ